MAIPEALVTALASLLGDRARTDEPLARHTSLRIGGPAELLVLPDTPAELGAVLRTAGTHAVRVTLLGGGSNLLVADGGIPGIVVKLGRGFAHLAWKEGQRHAVSEPLPLCRGQFAQAPFRHIEPRRRRVFGAAALWHAVPSSMLRFDHRISRGLPSLGGSPRSGTFPLRCPPGILHGRDGSRRPSIRLPRPRVRGAYSVIISTSSFRTPSASISRTVPMPAA